ITHSFIKTGDDNVAIKAGNRGPASNITVSHNHWYRGHGVSIGSETNGGARAIRVFDLSVDGADNGQVEHPDRSRSTIRFASDGNAVASVPMIVRDRDVGGRSAVPRLDGDVVVAGLDEAVGD